MMDDLEALVRIHARLRNVIDAPLVMFAATQGAANFTPAMLPRLWEGHPCRYREPIYKEAWYRGFYSASCW